MQILIYARPIVHGQMPAKTTGWVVETRRIESGVVMSVAACTVLELTEIKALVAPGIVTIGAYHQEHRLQIEMGHSPH